MIEMGLIEIGLIEIRLVEIRLIEIGFIEIRLIEIRLIEIGLCQGLSKSDEKQLHVQEDNFDSDFDVEAVKSTLKKQIFH